MVMLARDPGRLAMLQVLLEEAHLDGLLAVRPSNVRLLTGYWSALGAAVAISTRSGRVVLLVPQEEEALAQQSFAQEIRTYPLESLESLASLEQILATRLPELLEASGLPAQARLGLEAPLAFESASFIGAYQSSIQALASLILSRHPGWQCRFVDRLWEKLAVHQSPREMQAVAQAAILAGRALEIGIAALRPGRWEWEVAAEIQRQLAEPLEGDLRTMALVRCISGPRDPRAIACSGNRILRGGDLVQIHCDSALDGAWSHVVRTYLLGHPDPAQTAIYQALMNARRLALSQARPGLEAAKLDATLRQSLREAGFGDALPKKGLGHGVGVSALDSQLPPRLHPLSTDRLEAGMVFSLEPALEIPGLGALRHSDLVAVHAQSVELLTPFHAEPEDWIRA